MLVASGALAAPQLAEVLADWMGMPMVDLRDFTPDPEALRRVPRTLAERGPVLPLACATTCWWWPWPTPGTSR
jgi:hypothetical protein